DETTTLPVALTLLPEPMLAELLTPRFAIPTEAPRPTRPNATPPSSMLMLALSVAFTFTAPPECTVAPLMLAFVPCADAAEKLLTGVPPKLLLRSLCAVCTFWPAALDPLMLPSRLLVEPAVPLLFTLLSLKLCVLPPLEP